MLLVRWTLIRWWIRIFDSSRSNAKVSAMHIANLVYFLSIYLPAATKLGQGNVFTGVCDSVHRGGCLPQCMLGCQHPPGRQTPPGADTPPPPPDQTPPRAATPWTRHPPGADTLPREDTPQRRHPPGADTSPWEQTHTPLGADPPDQTPPEQTPQPPPPREADSGIRSTSGRYASYWNAFLLQTLFKDTEIKFTTCVSDTCDLMHSNVYSSLCIQKKKNQNQDA